MRIRERFALGLIAASLAGATQAAITIPMNAVDEDGVGDRIGQITVSESEYGLVFTPQLEGLDEGIHGFHLHQNGSCEPAKKNGEMTAAAAAGGHYDPDETGRHGTPWGDGHLGDLPALYVDDDGKATLPVLAPRPDLDDLKGRALMIHAGGDNYADQPKPLGGGGARAACGVVPE